MGSAAHIVGSSCAAAAPLPCPACALAPCRAGQQPVQAAAQHSLPEVASGVAAKHRDWPCSVSSQQRVCPTLQQHLHTQPVARQEAAVAVVCSRRGGPAVLEPRCSRVQRVHPLSISGSVHVGGTFAHNHMRMVYECDEPAVCCGTEPWQAQNTSTPRSHGYGQTCRPNAQKPAPAWPASASACTATRLGRRAPAGGPAPACQGPAPGRCCRPAGRPTSAAPA